MKVYILSGIWEYDGSLILSVFDTKEKAIKQMEEEGKSKVNNFDEYDIQEEFLN